MNINQHKFISLVPMHAVTKDFDTTIGEKVDIVIIGKGTLRGCVKLNDLAYQISKDNKNILIIDLEKGKPYIKILFRS